MGRTRAGMAWGVMALVCCGGACGSAAARRDPPAKTEAKQEAKTKTNAQQETKAKQMTREMIDEAGRRVAVPTEVRRIVSLAPNLTEIVYALGAEDRLTGVSDYSDEPPEAKAKPRIGMPVDPSLEAIVGARPDLVLATTAINRLGTVNTLAHLGIAVYATDPHTVEGMLKSITDIGNVIGARKIAEAVVARLEQRLETVKAKVAPAPATQVLFVVWENPLISVGDNTFIADALRWAGAESVVQTKQNWPQIGLEEVVRLHPEYLVYASGHLRPGAETNVRAAVARRLAELRGEPGWRDIPAVREGRVAVISDEVNLPAPGLIGAIEQLARELHPNAFEDATRHANAREPLTSKDRSRFLTPDASLLLGASKPRPESGMTSRQFCFDEHWIAQRREPSSQNPYMEANACAR